MPEPTTIITALLVGGLVSAANAAVNIVAANQRNRAIEESQKQAKEAARQETLQVKRAEAVNQIKNYQEAAQLQAKIRVASGEAGLALEGGSLALFRQAALDEAINKRMISANTATQIGSIYSGAAATVSRLESDRQSALLGGISAGITGFQSGFNTGANLGSMLQKSPNAGAPTSTSAGATQ